MELLYSRSLDMNGTVGGGGGGLDSDEDGEPSASIFKQKYERALKDLEFTKKRLSTQHEDDMEQLMALKKQLEKKVSKLAAIYTQSILNIYTQSILNKNQRRCGLRGCFFGMSYVNRSLDRDSKNHLQIETMSIHLSFNFIFELPSMLVVAPHSKSYG